MKITTLFVLLLTIGWLTTKSQNSTVKNRLDPSLANKLTISGFCLCQTTLTELKTIDSELKEVEVEEMDMCKERFVQDSRFINWKGYVSKKFPGIVFQKDNNTDFISKIRLTKDFIGQLPDGTPINMKGLLVRDVLKVYPTYNTWKSRGCSDYWNLTNDTIAFFVRIDKNKKPQYPIDEAYYLNKEIDGIDLAISCYSILNTSEKSILFPDDEPMFFLDSIRVNKGVLNSYKPDEIALVSVYKDTNAIRIAGKEAKNGAVYITTKTFAKNSYWTYFKIKSLDYQKSVPDMKTEESVVYILNNKILKSNFEGDLFNIDDSNFGGLTVINKDKLKKDYNINDKTVGVIITTILKQ